MDSIIKPLTEYNLLCEHYRFNIYNQFGTLNRYQIPKLPKGYKLDQKIGEIDKWDKYIINNIDEDKANKLLNFNFENFSKKLKDSTNYRKIVYERLKIYFNDSDCNNFSIFESKIGINTPNQIKEIQINVNIINKESEIIKNKINTTINWFVDDPNISKFSLYFFYTLFAFVFILRYLFYIIKWSVNTLKLKQ